MGLTKPWAPYTSVVSLIIGIVGLPNVGKSTLFNALTKAGALAANYPFATIEPNVGMVGVPDPRLQQLADIHGSAKTIALTVQFVDIAGIVRGASEGQGLGTSSCPTSASPTPSARCCGLSTTRMWSTSRARCLRPRTWRPSTPN